MWVLISLCVLLAVFASGEEDAIPGSTELGTVNDSSIYTYKEIDRHAVAPFSWISVIVQVKDNEAHSRLLADQLPMPGTVNTSFFVQQPVYVSLTTMASRMHRVNKTIISLIQARVLPTKIFLFISKDPYLLDAGVKHIPDNLLCLAAAGYLRIVYTNNIGPHRKLLPALKRFWGKDVFIATVDDDMSWDQGYIILYQLLKHHQLAENANSIVALRARRISICNAAPHKSNRYYTWPVVLSYNRAEMLLMPTGTGGILYKPAYFNKVIFHKALRTATGTADDLMFRLATLITKTPVQLGCSILRHRGKVIRRCARDEYDRKYDTLYGTNSTKQYQKLLDDAAAVHEAERAQKALLEKEREEGAVNEHDNEDIDSAIKHLVEQENAPHKQRQHRQLTLSEPDHSDDHAKELVPYEKVSFLGVESPQLSTERRLTVHKIKYRGISNAGSEKDLFAINRRGGNDQAWKLALDVLKLMRLLDFEELAAEFVDERDSQCYAANLGTRASRICGLVDCNKHNNRTSTAVKLVPPAATQVAIAGAAQDAAALAVSDELRVAE